MEDKVGAIIASPPCHALAGVALRPRTLRHVRNTSLAAQASFADNECACTLVLQRTTAGRPALHGGEPGQVRKEAAIANLRKCRGYGSPPPLSRQFSFMLRCSTGPDACVLHL